MSTESGGWIEAIGLRLFQLCLSVLPGRLRERYGQDLTAAFEARQAEARDRWGRLALPLVWSREWAGLVAAAVRARYPDDWARRTRPGGGDPDDRPTSNRRLHAGETLMHDLRFALRTFARRSGTMSVAIVTLALGIGASTAMFSVVRSVVLRPLPYPDPDGLVSVYPSWPNLRGHPTLGHLADRGTWSWPEFFAVDEVQTVFQSIAAFQPISRTVTGEGRPQRVRAAEATWDLFPMLGVVPSAGRLFTADDDVSGNEPVVLLTHEYWADRHGSDPDVVGRAVRLDGQAHTVVGILPAGFQVTGVSARIWVPKTGAPTDSGLGNHGGTRSIARLAPGVTAERAQAEVARILQEELPAEHGRHEAFVLQRQADEVHGVQGILWVLMGASLMLLVVACGNVAVILIGAGIDRERELAVRSAIGAGRSRIVRQLLTESGLLAIVAGVLGVAVAFGFLRGLVLLAPPGLPRLDQVVLDGSVLGFAIALATTCGFAFGAIPAVSLSGVDLARSIGTRGTPAGAKARLQAAVVVGELALATLLLVSGTLLARTVLELNAVDPGYEQDQVIAVTLAVPYERFRDAERRTDFGAADLYLQRMVDELSALPGVVSVATTDVVPLTGDRGNNSVQPEGWADPENAPLAERRMVSNGFFETLGVPIVEGRAFEPSDDSERAAKVIVVSRGLADLAWPDGAVLGRQLNYFGFDATVVGVAPNLNDEELERTTELAFYVPVRQTNPLFGSLLVRATGDAESLLPSVRDRVWSVDPDVPITRIATLASLAANSTAERRYRARLMFVIAGLAGLFAVMGIYGVTARSVARRTREFGIRVALGASRSRVRRGVTLQALKLAVFGIVAGLVGAVAFGRVLDSFLWGVRRTDPLAIGLVVALLTLTAVAAAFQPAVRATRVDPAVALRDD